MCLCLHLDTLVFLAWTDQSWTLQQFLLKIKSMTCHIHLLKGQRIRNKKNYCEVSLSEWMNMSLIKEFINSVTQYSCFSSCSIQHPLWTAESWHSNYQWGYPVFFPNELSLQLTIPHPVSQSAMLKFPFSSRSKVCQSQHCFTPVGSCYWFCKPISTHVSLV